MLSDSKPSSTGKGTEIMAIQSDSSAEELKVPDDCFRKTTPQNPLNRGVTILEKTKTSMTGSSGGRIQESSSSVNEKMRSRRRNTLHTFPKKILKEIGHVRSSVSPSHSSSSSGSESSEITSEEDDKLSKTSELAQCVLLDSAKSNDEEESMIHTSMSSKDQAPLFAGNYKKLHGKSNTIHY